MKVQKGSRGRVLLFYQPWPLFEAGGKYHHAVGLPP
jgi:hypothetical protein